MSANDPGARLPGQSDAQDPLVTIELGRVSAADLALARQDRLIRLQQDNAELLAEVAGLKEVCETMSEVNNDLMRQARAWSVALDHSEAVARVGHLNAELLAALEEIGDTWACPIAIAAITKAKEMK